MAAYCTAGVQVAVVVAVGLDEQDVGLGRDGVRPLHVQGDLQAPAGDRRAGSLVPPFWLTALNVGVGQAVGRVELVQVGDDVRVVVGIDDGNRLAACRRP